MTTMTILRNVILLLTIACSMTSLVGAFQPTNLPSALLAVQKSNVPSRAMSTRLEAWNRGNSNNNKNKASPQTKKSPVSKKKKSAGNPKLLNKKNTDKVGVVKQEWDLNLALTYMIPWKNPNSIFVYMFLTLYILGSISEAKSAAGGP